MMDRWWFLTSTTYGTWLPGEQCGFVSTITDEHGQRVCHNRHDSAFDADMPPLREHARKSLKCPPIQLDDVQSRSLLEQFQETATHREWILLAAGIMKTHFHLVVGVEGDPDPQRILGDFKAYGSRRLSSRWGKPSSGTWWTSSGSTRKLADEASVLAAVRYVRQQKEPLAAWFHEQYINDSPGEPGGVSP